MNNINQLYVQFLLFIETTTGNPIYFDKTEQVFIKKVGDTFQYLHSDSDSKILQIDSKHLQPLKELIQSGDLPEFYRQFTGQLPEHHRTITGTSSESYRNSTGKLPENHQTITGTSSELYRKVIGNIPEILYKLPASEIDEINKISAQIEKITIEVLKNTDKPITIKETVNRYREAEKFINKQNITELYKILNRIKLTRSKQPSPAKSEQTIARIKLLKKKIIIVSLSVFFALFMIFVIKINANKNTSTGTTLIESSEQLQTLLQTVITQKDTVITNWRKDYVLKNIALPLPESEAKEKINQLIIYKK